MFHDPDSIAEASASAAEDRAAHAADVLEARHEAERRAEPEYELIGWWHLKASIDGYSWDLVVSFSTGPHTDATDGRGPKAAADASKASHGPVRLNAAIWSLGSSPRRRSIREGIKDARRAIESYGWLCEEGESDARRKIASGTIRAEKVAR